MNKVYSVLVLVLFAGCGFPPPEHFDRFDGDPMVAYAEEKVESFCDVQLESYEVWMAESLEWSVKACYGGECCNKFGRIVIHPDTDEYVCQQPMHEMWHGATYRQHRGWYVEPTLEFIAYISESCRVFGGW